MAEVDDDLLAECIAWCGTLSNGAWTMVCLRHERPWTPWRVGPMTGPFYWGATPDSACRKWLAGYKRAARA